MKAHVQYQGKPFGISNEWSASRLSSAYDHSDNTPYEPITASKVQNGLTTKHIMRASVFSSFPNRPESVQTKNKKDLVSFHQ
jgi:hypothetical protein